MNPIINPWLVYIISVVDNVKFFIALLLVIFFVIVPIFIFTIFDAYEYEDEDGYVKSKKGLKKIIIGLIICSSLMVFIPSKETMYTMIVLDNVTPNNVQKFGENGKEIIDYIVKQVDKVVNK